MVDLVHSPSVNCSVNASPSPTISAIGVFPFIDFLTVSGGTLRIGGDSPNGLILVGSAPAARIVDCFTRDTINNPPIIAHVGRTVSNSSGIYSFTQLADRPEGYDVIIRGNINIGEKDVIVPGVHPVA